MKVMCIKSSEIVYGPTVYVGLWCEAETNSRENPSLGSCLIKFRDKKLTEIGI